MEKGTMEQINFEKALKAQLEGEKVYLLFPEGDFELAQNTTQIHCHNSKIYLRSGFGFGMISTDNQIKTQILKDEHEESLINEVNDFICDKRDVKLTWQAMQNPVWDKTENNAWSIMYICFIEYKE